MVLSNDFISLSTKDKCLWLKTPEGIAQLKEWLSAGYNIHRLAPMIGLNCSALYKICDRIPDLVAITSRPLVVDRPKVDLSKPLAYRIILNFPEKRGEILCEYATAEDLWKDPLIRHYFETFGRSELDYLDNYLKTINSSGLYKLSGLYSVVYGEITKMGVVKPKGDDTKYTKPMRRKVKP